MSCTPSGPPDPRLSPTQQYQREYWTALNEVLEKSGFLEKPRKARGRHWIEYPIGRSGFVLSASMHTPDGWIAVSLLTLGLPKELYNRLLGHRHNIEAELGMKLDWRRMPENDRTLIGIQNSKYHPCDESTWDAQHAWLRDTLTAFRRAFGPRIAAL